MGVSRAAAHAAALDRLRLEQCVGQTDFRDSVIRLPLPDIPAAALAARHTGRHQGRLLRVRVYHVYRVTKSVRVYHVYRVTKTNDGERDVVRLTVQRLRPRDPAAGGHQLMHGREHVGEHDVPTRVVKRLSGTVIDFWSR